MAIKLSNKLGLTIVMIRESLIIRNIETIFHCRSFECMRHGERISMQSGVREVEAL